MNSAAATPVRVHYDGGNTIEINEAGAASLVRARIHDYDSRGIISVVDCHPGKSLTIPGGRNEFETSRQKQIIEWLQRNEKPGRKRVLFIGDSVFMRLQSTTGYCLHAYQNLIDHFNITHIPHHIGGSKSVLMSIDEWLACRPDVVHFNTGLHDLTLHPSGIKLPSYNTFEQYASNLSQIIEVIKQHAVPHIIWASNTPLDEDKYNGKICRRMADIVKYNAAAELVMRANNVEINDLYAAIMQIGIDECMLPDGGHPNYRGSALIGRLVADRILKYQ